MGCMEQVDPQRLIPDLSWIKPLAHEATRSLQAINDKLEQLDLMERISALKVAWLTGAWQVGITVAVVLLFLFVLNLAQRK